MPQIKQRKLLVKTTLHPTPTPEGQQYQYAFTAPDGYHVVVGGYAQFTPPNVTMNASYPIIRNNNGGPPENADMWVFEYTTNANNARVFLYVICELGTPSTEVVELDPPVPEE